MLFLSVKQRSWLLSTEKRTRQSGKSPIIVEIRIINLRSLCSVYRKCSVMMPASGNENDLNMPSGTIEIFVRCYVEVERIMSAMDRTT